MNDTRPALRIVAPAGDSLPLYCHYDGQSGPQIAYVSLDLESGVLTASYDSQIGTGGAPESVYNGREIRWYDYGLIGLTERGVAALLDSCRAAADSILRSSTVERRNSNWIGVTYDLDSLMEIEEQVREACAQYDSMDLLEPADLFPLAGPAPGLSAEDILADAHLNGCHVDLDDLAEWLDTYREEDCRVCGGSGQRMTEEYPSVLTSCNHDPKWLDRPADYA